MVYIVEADWEASTGFGVGAASTDIITTATFDALEISARAWVNAQIRITTDASPVPQLLKDATICHIWSRVLTQQASVSSAESSGGVSIQELDFDGTGSSNAVKNLVSQAKAKMLEAKELLSLFNDPRDLGVLSVIDSTW